MKDYVFISYKKIGTEGSKSTVIAVTETSSQLRDYLVAAKKKLAAHIDCEVDEIHIFDWSVLGPDFDFIP